MGISEAKLRILIVFSRLVLIAKITLSFLSRMTMRALCFGSGFYQKSLLICLISLFAEFDLILSN